MGMGSSVPAGWSSWSLSPTDGARGTSSGSGDTAGAAGATLVSGMSLGHTLSQTRKGFTVLPTCTWGQQIQQRKRGVDFLLWLTQHAAIKRGCFCSTLLCFLLEAPSPVLYPDITGEEQCMKAEQKHRCPGVWPLGFPKAPEFSVGTSPLDTPWPQEQTCPTRSQKTDPALGTSCVFAVSSIQVDDLSIEQSEVELKENDAIHIAIKNVTAFFKGTLTYGYAGAWL